VALRQQLQVRYPVLTPEYLQGANIIFGLACRVPNLDCT
jgi:hypothetical protein